jgi:O-antigen/teichoic acid export membrane protein
LLRAAAPLVVATACARTLLNYAQGIGQVRRVAGWTAGLAACSAAVVVTGMALGGLRGWVAGRYVGELAMLACLGLALRSQVDWRGVPPVGYTWRPALTAGAGIAASLLLRSGQDNLPVVALNVARLAPTEIGLFGLPHAMVLGFQIIPAALSSVLLPRLAAAVPVPGAARAFAQRVGAWSTLGVSALALAVALTGPVVVRAVWPEYTGALPLLPVLLAAVPLRMLTSLGGIVLVAYDNVRATVMINAAAAAAGVLAYSLLTRRFGAVGTAWGFLAAEAVGAVAYVWAATRAIRGGAARTTSGPAASRNPQQLVS